MKLVVLGAPGAGKGTQANFLTKKYNIAHISTGDILRTHMNNKTEIGLQIVELMDSGKLVSDEIVIKLVKERIKEADCKNGFLLDGFPRNLYQAEVLSEIVDDLNAVVEIDVPDRVIVERMTGRRVCPNCGKVYHMLYNRPKELDRCDTCGTNIIQRKDDEAETVVSRLKIYHSQTSPLVEYYKGKGLLLSFDGTENLEILKEKIIAALGDDSSGNTYKISRTN